MFLGSIAFLIIAIISIGLVRRASDKLADKWIVDEWVKRWTKDKS